jgi:hypothetical protein
MGAVFCRRPVSTLTLEQEKLSGNSMLQLKPLELFLRLRIEGVYTGMALYDNPNVVWLRIHLTPDQTDVRDKPVIEITEVDRSNTSIKIKRILGLRKNYSTS